MTINTTGNLKREYKVLLQILKTKFGKILRNHPTQLQEIILVIILGHHLGLDTISAICARLGIPKHQIYSELRQMKVSQWRKLFVGIFNDLAIDKLQDLQSKSVSTQSRAAVVLSLDDSVLRRCGGVLGYLGIWWSGQFKRIVNGQDVVLAVVTIKGQALPVRFWIMSKIFYVKTIAITMY